MGDWAGKVDRKARKPYITEEIISKMEEHRKWKNENNERRKEHLWRDWGTQIERATDKATMEYIVLCDKIVEFQRKGRYDSMYTKPKELGGKKQWIQNTGIEYLQEYTIVHQW